MTSAKRVLLLHPADGVPAGSPVALLEQALRDAGAEVRCVSLLPPCEGLLDALAEGWMAVRLPTRMPGEPAS